MLFLAEMILLLMALSLAGYLVWRALRPKPKPIPIDQKAAAEVKEKKQKLLSAMDKIAMLASQEKHMDDQINEARRQVAKWKQIEAAATREEDLREVIRNRMDAERKVGIYFKAREELNATVALLRTQVNFAQEKVESSDSDLSVLSARLEAAKAREEIAGDLKAVTDLQEEVDRTEGRASANEEIDQFQRKAGTEDLDVEAELKQVMASRK